MARFIGWMTAYKGNTESSTSRTSASMIQSCARGWNVGGEAQVHAAQDGDKKHSRDSVRLTVDGGSGGSLAGYTVAWLTETDGKPELRIHLPQKWTREHDFSRVVLVNDDNQTETVIYQEQELTAEEK
jgi:hypothetical protein